MVPTYTKIHFSGNLLKIKIISFFLRVTISLIKKWKSYIFCLNEPQCENMDHNFIIFFCSPSQIICQVPLPMLGLTTNSPFYFLHLVEAWLCLWGNLTKFVEENSKTKKSTFRHIYNEFGANDNKIHRASCWKLVNAYNFATPQLRSG